MFRFIYRLLTSSWYYKKQTAVLGDLEDDWVALISDTELNFTNNERSRVNDELTLLRSRESSKTRLFIVNYVKEQLVGQELESEILPADVRGKIYKDVFNKLSSSWMEEIKLICPDVGCLEKYWSPSLYEKNIMGQMIDMAERTGSDRLTTMGLVQMIKNVHLSLVQSLNLVVKCSIDSEKSRQILEILLKCIPPIIDLWIKTLKNSRGGIAREGRLPEQWGIEQEIKELHLAELKREGKIDAKFKDGERDEIRARYIDKRVIERGLLVNQENMIERKNLLSRQLPIKSKRLPIEIPTFDFKSKKTELQNLLILRKIT